MKWSLPLYATLLLNLAGCQHFPLLAKADNKQSSPAKLEQLSEYGAKFAREYESAAEETCTKYRQLYQQGDWRAGWTLALQATKTKSKHCLNNKQAIQVLSTLESQQEINPELLWLTQLHLSWLIKLDKQTKKINQLKRANSRVQTKSIELEKENQDLVEKLDALKAIETSINQ